MKTLSDLKRKLTPGTKVILKSRFGKEINEEREVIHIQSNGIAFKTPESKKSWLEYPKASLLEFTENGFRIYGKGKRPLTPKEKEIMQGYEKIRDKKQEERDLLSDSSCSYFQQKRYYQQHNAEYLMGTTSQRGMKFDFSSGLVWDDNIKGSVDLEYIFV